MTSEYFNRDELEQRLSPEIVREIFDDNNDGNADSKALKRFAQDCSSEVDSFIRAVYPTFPLPTPVPNEIKRLALDVAEYRAARRHPEVVRRDWKELRKATHEDLTNLRDGKTRLDIGNTTSPNPPSNVGGSVGSSTGSGPTTATTPYPPSGQWTDMGGYSR